MDQTSQEHGIAVVQLIAAERRQREEGGTYRQQRWSIAHLDERILAFGVLWILVLSALLCFIVHPLAGLGLGVVAVLVIGGLRFWRRRRLTALREAQVVTHRRRSSP